ncbi:High-affinity nicotinic acid transporter [Exophiala dermatitidis]
MDKTFDVEQIEQYELTPAEVIAGSQQHQARTPVEKRLLRKADFVIIPLFSIVHLVSYLDRNSIGNARIMGLQKDLHMTAGQFYNCLTMFFIGYGISMFPANLTAKKFKPNRSLGVACMFFGVCLCGMAEAKNYSTILALRILLGCGQGFVQMAMIYCSIWYRRDEMATRTGIFYACATLSGAFGGLIAYGVQANMASPTGRLTWSWLFLIEGVLAVSIGLAVVIVLPRFPDDLHRRGKGHWLFNQEEIDLAHNRYAAYNIEREKFRPRQLLAVVKDIKTYFFGFVQGAAVLGVSVVGSFLPTFIHDFGFNPVHTQLFSVIPYTCAFVTVIVTGYISDRLNVKGPIIFTSCCVAMLGYILLMTVGSTVARVVATCLVTSACYPIGNLLPVWLSINTPGFTKRGGTWAFSEVFGVAFSIMGTRIYTNPPRYLGGHGTVLGIFTLGAVNVAAAYFWMRYQNNKKEHILNEYAHRGQIHPHIAEMRTLEQLEDEHISFRYVL